MTDALANTSASVIDRATAVFWKSGFRATSVTDLVQATGLDPEQIYRTYGSKRGLYLEVIDTYARQNLVQLQTCLDRETSCVKAIELYFQAIAEQLQTDRYGRGCLMINTLQEMASEDDQVRRLITQYLNLLENQLYQKLKDGQHQGELPQGCHCPSLAKALMAGIWGMRVLSITRPDPQVYPPLCQHLLCALTAAATAEPHRP